MKFDMKALALACAILWGGATLVVGLASLIFSGYGQHFLELLASVYPGYHAGRSLGQVVLATLYAAADGVIGGLVFGWLYNLLAHASGSRILRAPSEHSDAAAAQP